jgi:ketosteroid isomerase-like protein
MPLSNADKFRLAIEAVNRNDIDAALQYVDPKVEWRAPAVMPDTQTYHGHDGVRAWRATMEEAFEQLRLEPRGEFRELDDVHVLVPIRASGRGRESGVEVDVSFYMLGTGRDLLARMEFFPSEDAALAAVSATADHKI